MGNQTPSPKDFFISYNGADKAWAEWVAWILEEQDYTVVIQAWDFRPGGNFVLDMQRATESERTIMILSDNYLQAAYTQPEWAAAFKLDPQSLEHKLLPIRVGDCKPTGMLATIGYVDIVGKSEIDAEQLILDALKERAKPMTRPMFPGAVPVEARVTQEKIAFPGNLNQMYFQPVQKTPPMAIPYSTPRSAQSLTTVERLNLVKTLSAFPPAQFEEILVALNPPPGIVPDGSANQSSRASQLIRWVEGPTGRGLSELHEILALYTGNPL